MASSSSRSANIALASAGASAVAVVAATYCYRRLHYKLHPKHIKNELDAPSVTSTVEPDSMLTEDSYQDDGQPLVMIKERAVENGQEFEPIFPEFTSTEFQDDDDAVEPPCNETGASETVVAPKKAPSLWRTKLFVMGVMMGHLLFLYGATRDSLQQHYTGEEEIAPAPKLVVTDNLDDKSLASKVAMGAYGVAAYVLYSCKNGG